MKFSESWLREWVNPGVSTTDLVAKITMAGLEVDAVEAAAAHFSGVVVGQIISAEQHPDAEKLRVCRVAGHPNGEMQVVCGAPNARPGIKVPFALIDACLPGDFNIRKAKLRGVESFGMLCAEKELGVSEQDAGLWELQQDAPVGKDLRDYLALDDKLIEVDLTPNRGDCLSIKGLAREVGVLYKEAVVAPAMEPVAARIEDRFPVALAAGDKCPRYAGRVIRNVDVSRPSPQWLVEKLRRSGVRSIDAVVDVTNYVLLELGQPMHAFDLDKLNGSITVRSSREGEKITLLDDSEKTLKADTLLITDQSGAIAMAGVMGGATSAVSDDTKHIFLESAFFNPLAIVGKAREYGLHTDSSHRFERGVDPELCVQALERATALLIEIVGGEPGPVDVSELSEFLPQSRAVALGKSRLAQQLACELADVDVEDILQRLGLEVIEQDEKGWVLRVPSWRFDIAIEADLVEEVARIYGYNNLPTTDLTMPLAIEPRQESKLERSKLCATLTDRGFNEAITYSFVDPKVLRLLDPESEFVNVANPISSDMAVMRTTLWAGLIQALKHNLNRQQNRVKLFETGLRFVKTTQGLQQQPVIAGLIYGERDSEGWSAQKGRVDFYDIKGHVEALLGLGDGDEVRFVAGQNPALHPGQCAVITRGNQVLGYIGKIHPSVQKQLELDHPVYLFELELAPVLEGRVPAFREVSRFPAVRRDIALIVDQEVTADALLSAVRQNAGNHLVDLKIFDVYQGKGIENNRKSIALGLTFQEESRTLNENEITASVEQVVNALKAQYQATLRG